MALLARELRKRVRKWRIPFISLGAFNARLAMQIAELFRLLMKFLIVRVTTRRFVTLMYQLLTSWQVGLYRRFISFCVAGKKEEEVVKDAKCWFFFFYTTVIL